MTDNAAILEGYTDEWMANNGFVTFPILVKPGTDLRFEFRAWDMDNQEFIRLAGQMCTFFQYVADGKTFADVDLAIANANKVYAETGVVIAVETRTVP